MGKKLKILNIGIPVACAITLIAAPMGVWGAEAAWAANNFRTTCIGNINSSNTRVRLHHDYHTILTPKSDSQEICTLAVWSGGRLLDPNEYSYEPKTGALGILGEYITQETLIIYAETVDKSTMVLTSESKQTTTKADDQLLYTFQFFGTLPLDNIINISILNQTGGETVDMKLEPWSSEQTRVYDSVVNIDLTFANSKGLLTLEPCEITFDLCLSFVSGNTGEDQDITFKGLTAELTN